jgi:hypothetical protein
MDKKMDWKLMSTQGLLKSYGLRLESTIGAICKGCTPEIIDKNNWKPAGNNVTLIRNVGDRHFAGTS